MAIRMEPSFFFTGTTAEHQAEVLSRMTPNLIISATASSAFAWYCTGSSRFGIVIGLVPGLTYSR